MVYHTFRGIKSGPYFHKAINPKNQRAGWRVRTFDKPVTVAVFLANCIGRNQSNLCYETGMVQITDIDGTLVAKPNELGLIARLLSDDEASILKLFGIDLPKLAALTE